MSASKVFKLYIATHILFISTLIESYVQLSTMKLLCNKRCFDINTFIYVILCIKICSDHIRKKTAFYLTTYFVWL